MKKIRYLLMVMMLLLVGSPVLANTSDNIVDFSRKGVIRLSLKCDDEVVRDANIRIYKLADAYSENRNLSFAYLGELEKYKEDISSNNITKEVLEAIYDSSLFTMDDVSDNYGNVTFSNLDLGLYLIEQTNSVSGYQRIDPFVVYIPYFEDSSWVYEVNTTPKVDIYKLFDLTVVKEWNVVFGSSVPSEVTIELLLDEEVIDTIVLNNENDWTYTWNQIMLSDKYSVREINVPSGYTPTYVEDGNMFIVTNTKKLVQTGQMSWIVYLSMTMGLVFVLVGLFLTKREDNV